MNTEHPSSPLPGRLPTVYIPHGGGPCFFMDWNPPHAWDKTAAYLRGDRGVFTRRAVRLREPTRNHCRPAPDRRRQHHRQPRRARPQVPARRGS